MLSENDTSKDAVPESADLPCTNPTCLAEKKAQAAIIASQQKEIDDLKNASVESQARIESLESQLKKVSDDLEKEKLYRQREREEYLHLIDEIKEDNNQWKRLTLSLIEQITRDRKNFEEEKERIFKQNESDNKELIKENVSLCQQVRHYKALSDIAFDKIAKLTLEVESLKKLIGMPHTISLDKSSDQMKFEHRQFSDSSFNPSLRLESLHDSDLEPTLPHVQDQPQAIDNPQEPAQPLFQEFPDNLEHAPVLLENPQPALALLHAVDPNLALQIIDEESADAEMNSISPESSTTES